jgi:hypothetical protein
MLETSVYHSVLRISSVVMTLVLLFQSGLLSETTAQMATSTQVYMANSVGVFVGVAPTELNQMTAEITEQRLALDAREQALTEREIAVQLSAKSGGPYQLTTTFVLSGIVFILLVLILMNYALDFMRARALTLKQQHPQSV